MQRYVNFRWVDQSDCWTTHIYARWEVYFPTKLAIFELTGGVERGRSGLSGRVRSRLRSRVRVSSVRIARMETWTDTLSFDNEPAVLNPKRQLIRLCPWNFQHGRDFWVSRIIIQVHSNPQGMRECEVFG